MSTGRAGLRRHHFITLVLPRGRHALAVVRATKHTTSNKAEASATSDSCCGVNAYCTPAEQANAPINTVAEAKSASGCNCI